MYRSREDFDQFQAQQLPGDLTGVKLMHTVPLLRSAGPAWLTEAFHAAGSLPKDNSVVAIKEMVRTPVRSERKLEPYCRHPTEVPLR